LQPRSEQSFSVDSIAQSMIVLGAVALLTVLSVFAGIASADEGEPVPESSAVTAGLVREAAESPNRLQPPPPDSRAADQLPHGELDRAQALNLLDSVFGAEVEEPGGLFDSLEVKKFLSDHAAVVADDSGPETATVIGEEGPPPESGQASEPTLLESTLPLRVEDPAGGRVPVDLSLERSEGELQPTAPLVEAEIPGELENGISLANSDITIELLNAAGERAPSAVEDDAAFYPNVQADTDLLVAPIPTGVETWTQMRTLESPTTQEFHLNMPPGADLEETATGGAEVKLNGRALLNVPPATAVDAAGNEVPVQMSVHGDDLELVASVTAATQFPVLIDPTWQFESWNWTWGSSNFASWYPYHTDPSYLPLTYAYPSPEVHALDLTSGFAGSANVLSRAEWTFYVPRFYSDMEKFGHRPESFIDSGQLEAAMFLLEGNNAYNPVEDAGIIDEEKGEWVSVATHRGTEGEVSGWSGKYWFPNSAPDTHARIFTFQLATLEYEAQAKYRTALAGEAIVGFGDHNAPEITELTPPSGWMNATEPSKPSYAAADPGLGIYEVQLAKPIIWGNETKITKTNYKVGCTGIPTNPCPEKIESAEPGRPSVALEPQYMPEGPQTITFKAMDPLGTEGIPPNPGNTCCGEPYPHFSEKATTVKIDHSAPTLSLSGSLTEQASVGTTKAQYALKYSATDGSEEAPTLAVMGASGIFSHPADVALDAAENRWIADEANNRIVKCDSTGAVVASYSAVGSTETLSHPTGIDVDSSGNVWVVDSGHNRVVEFTSGGEWIRKVGKLGSGNSEINNPTGIAVGANGNVWVADTGNNRVQEFSSTGAFIGAFGGKGSASGQFMEPSAVDVGAGNKVWVADTGNNRIEELDEKGEFLAVYGSLGSGNGQLNHPVGIDVDTRGSVWVVDQGNGRVEQFSERGEYLGKFGSVGAGETQFNFTRPAGIASNVVGTLWVADSGNNRISRWYGPKGTRSGLRKVTIKVDGKVVQEPAVTCPQGGCPMSGEWTLHSGEYAAGAHTVEVLATDGVGLAKTEKVAITLNPPAPSVTLSGTLTQQSTLGPTLPRYGLKMESSAEEGTGSAPALPTFVSAITPTSETAKLSHPAGIAIDRAGNLWVVDKANNRVVEFRQSGEFVRAVGGLGSSGGKLSSPSGIALDSYGDLDVTDTANNRIVRFDEAGQFVSAVGANVNKTKVEAGGTVAEKNRCTASSGNVCQAGTAGAAEGLMAEPIGITTSGGGNFFVVEKENNRVEKFNTNGELLAKFGSAGSEPGQLKEPTAIATAPNGLWVDDTGNHRIEEWTSSYVYARQAGKEGSGNGEFKSPSALSVDPLGNVWVVDQGNNRVQKFSETGTYLGRFGKAGTGSGQFTLSAPTGIATDSQGNVWVSDTNDNRIERWRQGARSQLTTEVTIDGSPFDSRVVPCIVETCPLTREWTIESSTLAAGTHTLVAKATDGYGQWTTKTRTFEIRRDTTKPVLQVGGELANAPEGWVQQESYDVNASATDEKGYGVTSLVFRIDGAAVLSKSQTCSEGGCGTSISGEINMAPYSGGAHEAEVVATDGAGNSSAKHWTINVDPEGHISTSEATATIEAAEETGSANLVGDSKEEEGLQGTAPGLGLESTSTGFVATGSSAPTEVGPTGTGPITIEIPGPQEFATCPVSGEPLAEEESEAPDPECSTISGLESTALLPVSIELVEPSGIPTGPSLVEENAVVVANTTTEVDTSVRPLNDGGMIFEEIRDATGPEEFSYRINLNEEQELVQIDEGTVEVFLSGGYPSFTITATPASDAIGTEVPTTLRKTSREIVTLTVHHRAGHEGQPFVYPVVGGSGWEGGFTTVEVDMDNVQLEELSEEEELGVAEAKSITLMSVGPPELAPSSAEGWKYEPLDVDPYERRFKFTYCWPKKIPGSPAPTGIIEFYRANITPEASECHRQDFEGVHWATTVHGHYEYKTHHWVDVHNFKCEQWGPEAPKKERCKALPEGRTVGPANVIGEYRFHEGTGNWQWELKPTCLVWGGAIYPREAPSGGHVPYERPAIWLPKALTYSEEKCNWESYEGEALR
jgi:sugar lactone lactonase YvrE